MKLTHMMVLAMMIANCSVLLSQNVSVQSQDACPVQIVRAQFSKPGQESAVLLVARNASAKAVDAIGFKAGVTRSSGPNSTFGTLITSPLANGKHLIEPKGTVSDSIPLGWSSADSEQDSISVAVDYVLFSDGTHWGADTLKYSKTVSDMRTGALLYQKQLSQANSEAPK
ncbi:MAG TPA: hypothetical protein VMU45_14995 [Candidatus Eisenbacteria bacterium]|nr:hypothetical protein [Candidatus Eisenbacteria bacterium]